MRYYCEEGREALEALESSENGLSDAEAQKRLEKRALVKIDRSHHREHDAKRKRNRKQD